ncbi:MAG: hypothetical protein JWR02_2153 [Mucilaginibacter sp.]|nr:hypothetical protein [Mucilaginibacter sp.]
MKKLVLLLAIGQASMLGRIKKRQPLGRPLFAVGVTARILNKFLSDFGLIADLVQ